MNYVMLKDVCAIKMGQSPDSNSYNDTGDGVPFFQGNADFGERYPITRKWCSAPTKMATQDDILISVRAPIGAMNYAKEDCCIGRGLAALTPDKSKVSSEFIFWLLKGKNVELNSKGTGSTFKAIGRKVLEETKVPKIPLEKQKEFSEILERIYGIIHARKEELQKLDELIKARFVELFGDPISNPKGYKKEAIEKHIDLLSGYPFKSEQYVDKGINICGGLIIMPQKIKWEECVHWESTDGYEDYLLSENDIVMALDRPWIAEGFKIAKIDANHLPALLIQRTARIRALDLNQDYLYYCFINGGFDRHSNVTGSLVPHISAKDIRSFKVMLPPIELQNQFADFVRAVDKSKVAVQAALEETQLLFDSLMQEYFG